MLILFVRDVVKWEMLPDEYRAIPYLFRDRSATASSSGQVTYDELTSVHDGPQTTNPSDNEEEDYEG